MPPGGVSTTFCQAQDVDCTGSARFRPENGPLWNARLRHTILIWGWVPAFLDKCRQLYYLRLFAIESSTSFRAPGAIFMLTVTRPSAPHIEEEELPTPDSPPDQWLIMAADDDSEFDDFDEEDFDDEFDDDFEEELDDEYELADLEEVTDDDLADDDDGLDEFGGDFVDEDEEAEPAAEPEVAEEEPEGGAKKKKGKASPAQGDDD
jgi:hypothetical protein